MSSVSPLSALASPTSRSLFAPPSRGQGAVSSDFAKILNARVSDKNPASAASDVQLLQALSQGSNLIGKSVVYSKNGGDATAKGIVQSLRVEGGKIQLVVDGTAVPLDRVRSLGK